MKELLTCEGLTKSYQKGTNALDDIELHIGFGRIVGLLGPNGSGKTTLIKLANGLLQPTAGSIKIAGMDPGPDTKAIVSYLPDAAWLPDWMRVEQLVEMFRDFYADFDPAKANEMLEKLELSPKAPLKSLSKGNKEKVQLILAMSRNARLYLLDEPIGGVDPAARDYILNTILTNYSRDASVIISTHLIEDVEPVLDEAVFLKNGRIFAHRSVDELPRDRGHECGCIFPGGIQMLKKLLKYEFKATARTYGGMYLALLAASVLFGGSVWRWNSTNSDAYSTLVGLLSLVYTAVIIGTVVVTIMTIVQRFYRNLLGREGYLMHTLPVTETQLVTSKLISSTVWSLCSILAACLSFGILAVLMMADMDLLEQLPLMWSGIREAFARCNMEFWGALAFSGVVGFVRMVSVIACIYAACMVGHQFKNHPALAGILSFFVMQYVQGWLEKLLQIGTGVYETIIYSAVGDVGSIETAVSALGYMGSAMVTLGIAVAFGVFWFGLTVWLMRNKLNLE